jgi:hypothetical protein
MAAKGWSRAFDDPIPLPRGRQLVTLKDAGNYVTKLPKAEHEAPEWQAAMECLIVNRRSNFGRRSPGLGGQYCRPNDNLGMPTPPRRSPESSRLSRIFLLAPNSKNGMLPWQTSNILSRDCEKQAKMFDAKPYTRGIG